MSNRKAIGHLKSTGNRLDIEWEIPDFLSLSAEVDECHCSSTFFCGLSWYLEVYPNDEEGHSEGYVGVYICKGDSGPPVSATYSLFFKSTDGRKEIINGSRKTFEKEGDEWGVAKAIKRSVLIDQKWKLLPSGVLTVLCSMKCDETQGSGGTEKLLRDLKGLAINGDESDVTISVQGDDFRLHRGILAARTPVFNSMFQHDMKEKATGVVTVVDCEAGPFRTFVQYLYTGTTYGITAKNVFGLYRISHKYQVDELKAVCLHGMKNTLSVDTFCETLDLALLHDERDLVEHTIQFLSENASEIVLREDWQTRMKSNTKEMCECLGQALVKKDKKLAEALKE